MTNSLGPTAQQDELGQDLLTHLHNLTMYLQFPEGGVKTALPDEIACRDRYIVTGWNAGVSCPA